MPRFVRNLTAVVVVGSLAYLSIQGVSATLKNTSASTNTIATGTPNESDTPEHDADNRLVVHEWGTFTNYSGSDGVKLEFRPLVENDIPAFVDRIERYNRFWLGKSNIRSIQRMETPVTYFYTPVERDVSVRVDFPEGLLTEFYPPVRSISPKSQPRHVGSNIWSAVQSDSQPVPQKDGSLDWGQIHLIPTGSLNTHVEDQELSKRMGRHVENMLYHDASRFPHYNEARRTDSAVVQYRSDKTDHFEKFLFYRGVGNFELPLTLQNDTDETFVLTNNGADAVNSLFLVASDGKNVKFRKYDNVSAGGKLEMNLPGDWFSLDALTSDVVEALVAEGLYEKEAKAMIACWKSSWFGEPGTRLLYMVPQRLTDAILPLHISPTPDEVVRVLVGRMEIMSQDEEQEVVKLVKASALARAVHGGHIPGIDQLSPAESQSPDSQSPDSSNAKTAPTKATAKTKFENPSMTGLKQLGRFAEPALVRVRNIAEFDDISLEATLLLHELRSEAK